MTEDCIILEGMTFYGFHGVAAAEKELGQRFVVDAYLSVDLTAAGSSDDLNATVHYGHVYQRIKRVVEGEPCNLIEAVAARIAREILGHFPAVEEVRVRVKKPEAPIRGVLGTAAVEIVRRRSEDAGLPQPGEQYR